MLLLAVAINKEFITLVVVVEILPFNMCTCFFCLFFSRLFFFHFFGQWGGGGGGGRLPP